MTPRTPAASDRPTTLGRALRPHAKLLAEDTRRHNRALVCQTLYRGEQISRADIARLTGLTRVTVSDLVADLMEEGLVVETGTRSDTRPGKPATLLRFDPNAYQVVGLDLSGHTSFRGALMDLRGEVVSDHAVAIGDRTGDDALALALDLARTLAERAGRPLLGVGIGSPGVVTTDGVVVTAPNLGWRDLDLRQAVAAALGVATVVGNDANAAVLAEHSVGAGHGDLMLVRVGHGVGAGLLLGGTPLFGSHFAAGEIGHVVVGTDGGRPCVCGKVGCLEAWLSVPNLQAQLDTTPGEPDAVLREAGRRLGVALAPVVGALDLAEIVLSGPPDLLEGSLVDATVSTLHDRTMADFHGHLAVRMSWLGEDIVVRGAAVMVLSGQLGVS
ncbi:MAG: ROK family transcriptional regulator [Nocardioidaceae bacterium]